MQQWRRAIAPALFAVGLAGSGAAAQQQPAPKFAFIRSQVVLQRAPGSAEAQAAVTRERETLMGSAQRLQDSLKSLADEYTKTQASLSPAQREQKEKAFRDKQAEYERRLGQMEQQMQQKQFELLQPIMNQIKSVLETVRNEEGYTFIFDVDAEGGMIVAADKNLDITERVIARLRPVPSTATRPDSARAPSAAKPAPAGIKPPSKPPAQ
jgi:outer membrane protein